MDNDKLFSAFVESSQLHTNTLEAMLDEINRCNDLINLKMKLSSLISISLSEDLRINRELQGLPPERKN